MPIFWGADSDMDYYEDSRGPERPDPKPSFSVTLSAADTRLWEDEGPDGDAFRKATRGALRTEHERAEIYSHDGVMLDWVEQEA